MRVVTPKKLVEYSKKHPSVKIPLLHWFEIIKNENFKSLSELKEKFNHVDYVGNNRYVFNIKGNDFGLVCIIICISNKAYIRFIGTHSEYDKIDATKI